MEFQALLFILIFGLLNYYGFRMNLESFKLFGPIVKVGCYTLCAK